MNESCNPKPQKTNHFAPAGCFIALIILFALHSQLFAVNVKYETESFSDPYSYYSQPSMALGIMDGQGAFAIYPDFWGRLAFFTGEHPTILQKRVKTRYKGYLPIIQCSETRDKVLYRIEAFAANLTPNPEDELMMFVKLSVKNQTKQPQKAVYWAASVYSAKYTDSGSYSRAEFDPDRAYKMNDGMATENGKLLFMYDETEIDGRYASIGVPYTKEFNAEQAYSVPMSAVCMVKYQWYLQPGQSKSTIIKVPLKMLPSDSKIVRKLKTADYEKYFKGTVDFWDSLLSSGTQFQIPQDKTINTLKTSFIDQLIAREKRGKYYAQFVSRIQYPRTFFRDGIFTMRIYDLFGHPEITRQNIRFLQGTGFGSNSVTMPRGMKLALNPRLDDTRDLSKYPQKLWRFADYFLMSHDKKYAKEILPEIKALTTWIEKATAADERGLIPRCTLCDNEFVGVDVPGIKENGHRSGDNFWAVAALRATRLMAQRMKSPKLVAQTDRVLARLVPAVQAAVDKAMKEAGYVPGTFDRGTSNRGDGWGEDRDNILLIWPHEALDPFDPAIDATIKRMRSRYEWGVLGHYDGISGATFPYRSIWMMEAMVIRGEQKLVVEDLYGQLAHTGSTHGSYEVAWKPRYGIEQHGWFNANYPSLIRNMLVREDWSGNLHLLSVVPAEWAGKVGNKIGIKDAATFYGPVSFTKTILEDGAEIILSSEFKYRPKSVILHLPYFADVSKVLVDGKSAAIKEGTVEIPLGTEKVRLFWKTKPREMAYTYNRYLKKFRKTLPPIRIPIRYFHNLDERRELWKLVAEQPWKVIGPFADDNHTGLKAVYPPENELNFDAKYLGSGGQTVQWIDRAYLPASIMPTPAVRAPWYRGKAQTTETNMGVDFSVTFKGNGAAYAVTNVWSPKQQQVTLSLGSDGPVKVWLNKAQVHESNAYRGWNGIVPDSDKVAITLNKGLNTLLVKTCRGGTPWGFALRMLNSNGKPIKNLKFENAVSEK